MAKGIKTGGRQPGTPNKVNSGLAEKLERMGCKPDEFLALTMMNRLPCDFCTEETRCDCQTCAGTGYEQVPIKQRVQAGIRLIDSVYPKLASRTVDKHIRRVAVVSMNHLNAIDEQRMKTVLNDALDDSEVGG